MTMPTTITTGLLVPIVKALLAPKVGSRLVRVFFYVQELTNETVLYDETIEYNDTLLFSSINPANLPLALINGICTPIYPHMRLRTNTVFEVAHSKGNQL